MLSKDLFRGILFGLMKLPEEMFGKSYLRVWECPRCRYGTKHGESLPVLSLDDWCAKCTRKIPEGNMKLVWAFSDVKPRWYKF